jgi:hypothetical protein
MVVKNNIVHINKSPVIYKDGVQSFSASDGGFLYYKGVLSKTKNLFVGLLKLIDCDYFGFAITNFKIPKLDNEESDNAMVDTMQKVQLQNLKNYDSFRKKDATLLYIPKGFKTIDIVISLRRDEVWVNNVLFKKK